ncbi:MAG TPA: hypothetical protein VKT77_01110 [Chthonomonadaceae bacterium]|nr:hypothetical protein [Chthonomonadaceae bacterium]
MTTPSRWDRSLTWVLGYIVPWAGALGGAWFLCALGARLHLWGSGAADQAIQNLVLHVFIVPLAIFGGVALPIAAWPLIRGRDRI